MSIINSINKEGQVESIKTICKSRKDIIKQAMSPSLLESYQGRKRNFSKQSRVIQVVSSKFHFIGYKFTYSESKKR